MWCLHRFHPLTCTPRTFSRRYQLDILIEDSNQGMERKIWITDSRPASAVRADEMDDSSERERALEYIDSRRAIFQARQQILSELQKRRGEQGEPGEPETPPHSPDPT